MLGYKERVKVSSGECRESGWENEAEKAVNGKKKAVIPLCSEHSAEGGGPTDAFSLLTIPFQCSGLQSPSME